MAEPVSYPCCVCCDCADKARSVHDDPCPVPGCEYVTPPAGETCPSGCGRNEPCPDPWHDRRVTRPGSACPDCGHADSLHYALGHGGCHDLRCSCKRVTRPGATP